MKIMITLLALPFLIVSLYYNAGIFMLTVVLRFYFAGNGGFNPTNQTTQVGIFYYIYTCLGENDDHLGHL